MQYATCSRALIAPTNHVKLSTDASLYRWGAVLESKGCKTEISGLFPPDIYHEHIGVKELYGAYAAIHHF